MDLSEPPEGHVGVERRRKGGAGQGWCRGLPARAPGGGIESSPLGLRRRWSLLALRLLGHWRRGPPLVRFPKPPGVVVDLDSSLLALSPCVLEREGAISEPALPPPPPACQSTQYGGGSRLAGRWWCGRLGKRSPLPWRAGERGYCYS